MQESNSKSMRAGGRKRKQCKMNMVNVFIVSASLIICLRLMSRHFPIGSKSIPYLTTHIQEFYSFCFIFIFLLLNILQSCIFSMTSVIRPSIRKPPSVVLMAGCPPWTLTPVHRSRLHLITHIDFFFSPIEHSVH